jgi:serine/threonine protein kinase
MTAFGQIVGTPRYMAPEQLAGERGDAKSDVFSLGCILFEMLSGRPMFLASRFSQLLKERANWTMPSAEEIRPGLDRTLYRLLGELLEEDPDARNVDLSDLAAWAATVDLAGLGIESGGVTPCSSVTSTSDTHIEQPLDA